MIPLEVLKSHYQQPYYALIREINKTASTFVKAVLTDQLILNPDISLDEQAAVINQAIADSGMERQMSSCISKTYNVEQLYQMALELRQKIECALWPYIDLKTCLVFDLDNPDAEPVTYNTLTRQICRDGIWENQELDLQWKFIVYPNTKIHPNDALFKKEMEKNDYDYLYGNRKNCTPVSSENRGDLPHTAAFLLGN